MVRFAALIPGAVRNLLAYLLAIVAGTLVTTGALFVLKRPLPDTQSAAGAEAADCVSGSTRPTAVGAPRR